MSDNDDVDYESAKKELEQAVRDLCKISGEPVPDLFKGKPPFCSFCFLLLMRFFRIIIDSAYTSGKHDIFSVFSCWMKVNFYYNMLDSVL